MAWIESHIELRNNPKLIKLSRLLGVNHFEAIGVLHCLWWWTFDYAKDGDISRIENIDLATALGWAGDPDAFKSALVSAGFLDLQEGKCLVHDWGQYGGKSVVKLEGGRERVRQYRQRKSAKEGQSAFDGPNLFSATETPSAPCNADVTVTDAIRGHDHEEYSSSSSSCAGNEEQQSMIKAQTALATMALPAFEACWPELPKVTCLTEGMVHGVDSVMSRVAEANTVEFWQRAAARAKASSFLRGQVPGRDGKPFTGMSASWFFKPDTLFKILNGQYDTRQADDAPTQSAPASVKRRRKASSPSPVVSGYSSTNTTYPDHVEAL